MDRHSTSHRTPASIRLRTTMAAGATLTAITAGLLVATPAHAATQQQAATTAAANRSTAASAAVRSERIMRVVRAQAGDPYVYGAAGPDAFDCSGLTSYVYRVALGITLPRTSAGQRGAAAPISARAARAGDLVFFHSGSGVYHVGVYAGAGLVWHAPYSGSSVRRERIWTSAVSYGRVG